MREGQNITFDRIKRYVSKKYEINSVWQTNLGTKYMSFTVGLQEHCISVSYASSIVYSCMDEECNDDLLYWGFDVSELFKAIDSIEQGEIS